MLELTFLGTAAAVPSRDRMMSCVAVKQGPSVVLFDCAEGTQRQLMLSHMSFMKVDAVFVTHLHGDHILGLPGLLQTMGMTGRDRPLLLCGPKGFLRSIGMLMEACEGELEYDLDIREVSPGDVIELNSASVSVFATEHGVPSVGYLYREKDRPGRLDRDRAIALGLTPGPEFSRLVAGETVKGVRPEEVIGPVRKGMSIAYTGDTVPLDSISEACRGADVLIHEATYCAEEAELAEKNLHSTCVQAADAARKAGVRCLILTHISNRYNSDETMVSQSRAVFPETYVARDMDVFEISADRIRQA
jgi:ribonuclease Z